MPIVQPTQTKPDATTRRQEQTRGERYFYLGTQAPLVVIAGVGIAVAIRSLISLNRSVRASNSQAASGQKQLELSERPWVGASGPATLVDGAIKMGVQEAGQTTVSRIENDRFKWVHLCVQNAGSTPARIEIVGDAFFSAPVIPESENALPKDRRLHPYLDCRQEYWEAQGILEGWTVFHGFPATLLFPRQQPPLCANFMVTDTMNRDGDKVIADKRAKGQGLYFMGCIDYLSPLYFHYQTQICRYYDADTTTLMFLKQTS